MYDNSYCNLRSFFEFLNKVFVTIISIIIITIIIISIIIIIIILLYGYPYPIKGDAVTALRDEQKIVLRAPTRLGGLVSNQMSYFGVLRKKQATIVIHE